MVSPLLSPPSTMKPARKRSKSLRSLVVVNTNDIGVNGDYDVETPLSFSSNDGNDNFSNGNEVESESEAERASEAAIGWASEAIIEVAVGLASNAMAKKMVKSVDKVDKVDGPPTSPPYVVSLEEMRQDENYLSHEIMIMSEANDSLQLPSPASGEGSNDDTVQANGENTAASMPIINEHAENTDDINHGTRRKYGNTIFT